MWGGNKRKKVDFDSHVGNTTMVARGTEIKGDVYFSGGLLVEGTIRGAVNASGGTDALLRLGESGLVEGKIDAPNVVVGGTVNGDIFSSGLLELAANGVVKGTINYNLLEMVMGAEVSGSMVHVAETAKNFGANKKTSKLLLDPEAKEIRKSADKNTKKILDNNELGVSETG